MSGWPSGLRRQTQGKHLPCLIYRVCREFWSSYEGVGSNPTSDKIVFEAFYCTFPWFIMGSTIKFILNDENVKVGATFEPFKIVITDYKN